MSGHTPGPWRQFAPEVSGVIDPTYRSINAGEGFFGRDGKGFGLTSFMREEDARLIAAAPDMLKALQAVADSRCLIDDCNAENLVHDAIRKATGEDQ